ncbi:hypothetical protein FQV27_05675 [Paracoccus aurantiacus]|uniref:Glycosyltransferase n=1 Tax=Paracoccus aurantiacus TaxID=2599412 RepID=A0A5C6S6F5_9RHOB|nr:glycosyltransferase family 4 protein [Paracoccus aurantiacus]TXB69611.1 hypothetical protein FQV27_05675 [Paracoccus aurantiacus]
MNPSNIFQRLAGRNSARLAEVEIVRPYVDSEFYFARNPDVAATNSDAAQHYHLYGWKEGRDPSADFSTRKYLSSHPELLVSQTDPLLHYASSVDAQRHTSDEAAEERRRDAETLRPHFDAGYYLERNPDVAEAGADPLLHFVQHGWREGRDPNPEFSVADYLAAHEDVAESGGNPFLHYIRHGKAEGRVLRRELPEETNLSSVSEPSAAEPSPAEPAPPEAGPIGSMEDIRPHFDVQYYLVHNEDVRESGIDPVAHYWGSGWLEGRDPTPEFSTRHYLETNPDISGQPRPINPFWHYVIAGRNEGRTPQHPGGYRVEQLRHTKPLEQSVADWIRRTEPGDLLDQAEIEALIAAERPEADGKLVVALGHDNYQRVSGGVQFCINHEEQITRERGGSYLNVHPWQPLPRLAHATDNPDPIMVMVLDGNQIGLAHMSALIGAIRALTTRLGQVRVVVHHLLGHLPEQVCELVEATGSSDCWYWLHDYFAICPGVTLRRNGVSYCGAPPVTSNACTLCRFGAERVTHLERMQSFFDRLNVHVVAPSSVALDLFDARADFTTASETVLPHMLLTNIPRDAKGSEDVPSDESGDPDDDRVITVGFLGTPAAHKGWHVFERLMSQLRRNPSYRFVFFGTATPSMLWGTRTPVHVTAADPNAMIDAVAAENCDLVLHWATWPETFSLSTYEAYAGGAWVLTNRISGNVAATVRATERGEVFATQDDLIAFFEDGRAEAMAEALRAERATNKVEHQLSQMIYDIWDAEEATA